MIDAILWDNDGVLVDSEMLFYRVTCDFFRREGLALEPERWMREYLGEGRSSKEIALALGGERERVERMVEERNQAYRRLLEEKGAPVRPGVKEALAALAGTLPMALVTSSPRDQVDVIHRATGLLRYFQCVVTSDDCPRLKPHPDAYLAASARLGIPPERCLAVEDSRRGLAAARAAGIRCVMIPHELTDPAACAEAWRIERRADGLIPLAAAGRGV